ALLEDVREVETQDQREQVTPMASLLRREQIERIRTAISMLSNSDQEIIDLSYELDHSCKEIMEVMQKTSVTAVTTHLYKAMKKLRTLVLSDEEHTERAPRSMRTGQ